MHLLIWNFFSSNEEIDADGACKNVKVRKKKESQPLNTSIPRIFTIETPSCEASKEYY
jgi:hypothetical protein